MKIYKFNPSIEFINLASFIVKGNKKNTSKDIIKSISRKISDNYKYKKFYDL